MRLVHLTLVVVALLAAGCGATPAPTAAIPAGLPAHVAVDSRLLDGGRGVPQVGAIAPDFSFTMQDGTAQKLSDLRGRLVLVNFWATWCAPCKEEMPDLQRIADERGDQVVVLGVNKLETLEAIGPFAGQIGTTFTLVPNPAGDISDRYAAKNIPTTYFLNSDGTIGAVQLGVMTYEQASEQIARLH